MKLIKLIGIISLFLPVIIPLKAISQELSLNKNQIPLITINNQNHKRIALVIGNSNYQQVGQLANPVNDANDMAKTLTELGFEVIIVTDANLKDMNNALDEFDKKIRKGGVGVFFYAGHGLQVEGENYLIPIDAKLTARNDVQYETLPVGKVLNRMEESGNDINIIIPKKLLF